MSGALLAAWRAQVARAPGACAVIEASSGRVWTRADVHAAAVEAASRFPADVAGGAVCFALPNGAPWLVTFLALLEVGAVPVPLDPSEPEAAQRDLAVHARSRHLLEGGRLVRLKLPPGGRRFPAGTCLVKLTSGSSGRPSALPFTDAQILADGRQVAASMDLRADDLNLALIPLGHSYGIGNLLVPLLDLGLPFVCASSPLPHGLAADCLHWRPTVFPTVPAVLRALVDSEIEAAALCSLRTVISAGSALAPELAAAFLRRFDRRIHNFYGSSETGGIAYDRTGDATLEGRAAGMPLEGVRIEPAAGGRFRVRSAAVLGAGVHRPADLGEFNERGELVLKGRAGRLVKIAGRRLDLGDLERSMRSVEGVRDAFVAVHPGGADQLAAVVETDLTQGALMAALRERIAAWKLPRRLLRAEKFPLTDRGKTDARELRRMLGLEG